MTRMRAGSTAPWSPRATRPGWWRATTTSPGPTSAEDYLRPGKARTLCFWKGLASHHDLEVDGVRNPGAFYYPKPSPLVRRIKDHVAFWQGVQVRPAFAEAEK